MTSAGTDAVPQRGWFFAAVCPALEPTLVAAILSGQKSAIKPIDELAQLTAVFPFLEATLIAAILSVQKSAIQPTVEAAQLTTI